MDRSEPGSKSIGLTSRPQWHALQRHALDLEQRHLRDLFAVDANRGENLQAEADGLYLDYSKQRVTSETLHLLMELASACGLPERTAAFVMPNVA